MSKFSAINLLLFGAMGDLALRKIYPALYHLDLECLLADNTRILCLARKEMFIDIFKIKIIDSLKKYVEKKYIYDKYITKFINKFFYIEIDFLNFFYYKKIYIWIKERDELPNIIYLSVPSNLFGIICDNLNVSGCIKKDSRVVVEKPIGSNFETSIKINNIIGKFFEEKNIYRIDHYLGKYTVQNILALRFANPVFYNQWNRKYISHVEITVAESVGIEGRWSYFDHAGQLRDMVQNHIMQLLCIITMEPPRTIDANSIRDEKVKVLKALRTIEGKLLFSNVVYGQYTNGICENKKVPGYNEEKEANIFSKTETFVALKTEILNCRWAGVPFYLRTGKRMPKKLSQIVIHFRKKAYEVFNTNGKLYSNKLIIRLQPNEGISLEIINKDSLFSEKGINWCGYMNIDFNSKYNRIPDAYENLFLEIIKGNQYLFVRRDEVEYSWRWIDKIIYGLKKCISQPEYYSAGSWGPNSSITMIHNSGHTWEDCSLY
ncbi:Glucose-6-phosphate 1-dehydrogenase [Candidatus Johnevansia muelleri]|uniref:Glucose-6-phosphate 1-dehydrogenase n=1 Tax=Candidatus Johnevansia muelleri TaxID=1495769 RepID=A0A078KDQ3_9GAMM|nr:Glucose-6-phosphate 1-dehydrogenase [Candidatus Evansia muelleri]